MRVARSPLSLLLLSALSACGGAADNRVGVRVTPTLPAGLTAASFRVIGVLGESESPSGPQVVTPDKVPFTLVLPAGTRGKLHVELKAADGNSLLIADGHGDVDLGDALDYELGVTLERRACTTFCYDQASSRDRSLFAVFGTTADDVYAVGQGGAALHYDGFAWESLDVRTQEDLHAVWGSGEGDMRVAGGAGTVIKLGEGPEATDQGRPIYGLWGSGPNDIWAVGEAGLTIHFNGTNWQRSGLDVGTNFSAVWGASATDVWAIGDFGVVMHYDGSAWGRDSTPTTQNLHAIAGTSTDGAIIVGDGGLLLRRSGGMWLPGQSGTERTLLGLWGRDELWAVGEAGTALAGRSDTLQSRGSTGAVASLYSVWGDGEGTVFAVGDFGAILRYRDGAWKVMHMGPMMSSLRPPRDGSER